MEIRNDEGGQLFNLGMWVTTARVRKRREGCQEGEVEIFLVSSGPSLKYSWRAFPYCDSFIQEKFYQIQECLSVTRLNFPIHIHSGVQISIATAAEQGGTTDCLNNSLGRINLQYGFSCSALGDEMRD